MITIFIGVMIVWGWVAFISEAIARRSGSTPKVPYPDDVLWGSFGGTLLNLGLFGGAPTSLETTSTGESAQAPAARAPVAFPVVKSGKKSS